MQSISQPLPGAGSSGTEQAPAEGASVFKVKNLQFIIGVGGDPERPERSVFLIRILPSRTATRGPQLASWWPAARLRGQPRLGAAFAQGIVVLGSAPSCPELKGIEGTEEVKGTQELLCSQQGAAASTELGTSGAVGPGSLDAPRGGELLLLGRSLSPCPSLSPEPASGGLSFFSEVTSPQR